ncbi:hypothetical protein [Nocardia sp. NPDC057455]|uniref:hypothetical protein n=1 Tax=Nocardia sp. NPDC057455 TaxID=3346138 RepID=UPI0036707310
MSGYADEVLASAMLLVAGGGPFIIVGRRLLAVKGCAHDAVVSEVERLGSCNHADRGNEA